MPCTLEFSEISYEFFQQTQRLNYKKTDWDQYRKVLQEKVNINSNLHTKSDIDDSIQLLSSQLTETLAETTPKLNIKQQNHTLPDDIQDLIKMRNKKRKEYQKHRTKDLKQQKKSITDLIQ